MADPVSGSLGAWQLEEESDTAAGGLVDGERSTSVEDGSVMIPKTMVGNVGPSRSEAGVAGDAPESGSVKPVASEELTVPPKAS